MFQRDTDRIGTIICDYDAYNANSPIGEGGFAKVYKHVKKSFDNKAFAVKEEAKEVSGSFIYLIQLTTAYIMYLQSSLISDLTRFAEVLKFDHPNVMYLKEYVTGQLLYKFFVVSHHSL